MNKDRHIIRLLKELSIKYNMPVKDIEEIIVSHYKLIRQTITSINYKEINEEDYTVEIEITRR